MRDHVLTDSELTAGEINDLEVLIDKRGIEDVLMALHEICDHKSEHVREMWQDYPLAKRWATVAGAIGVTVTKATGL